MTRQTLCRIPLLLLLMLLEAAAAPLPDAATDRQYILVFDAGSTGTRLNVFEFRPDCSHTTGLRIISLKGKDMVPGLSAFANAPERLRSELEPLMTFAAESVPKLFQASTPAIVRATAGLRVLTDVQRRGIVRVVAEVLGRSAFKVPKESSQAVSILSGKEEAKFGWVAVNFLKGAFDKPGRDTYGMLDLGGGSTQITFVPDVDDPTDPNRVVFETARGQRYPLYARSFLNLGMSQASLDMFGFGRHSPPPPVYTSDCLNPRFSGKFSFGLVSIKVTGHDISNVERFRECRALAGLPLRMHAVEPPPPPAKVEKFVALSSFFYTARNLRKLNFWDQVIPGSATLEDLLLASEGEACWNPPTDGKFEPYLCLNAWYVFTLLHSGYRMPLSQSIDFAESINGYSVGWPLGFAINYLRADVKRRCL